MAEANIMARAAQRSAIKCELEQCRERLSKDEIQKLSKNIQNELTVGVLAAGVGVCTYSSVRAGFRPIWMTEVDEDSSVKVWKELYSGECLSDTFKVDYNSLEVPMYLTLGQPCPDYARSSQHAGQCGKTGWMFLEQMTIILKLLPLTIRL